MKNIINWWKKRTEASKARNDAAQAAKKKEYETKLEKLRQNIGDLKEDLKASGYICLKEAAIDVEESRATAYCIGPDKATYRITTNLNGAIHLRKLE